MDIAILGCGGVSYVHSQSYLSRSDVTIRAVVDIQYDRAEKLAETHNAKAYTSVEEMLANEKIDMVDICLPTYLHEEMAIKALNRKINVLCEKPMALTAQGAKNMANTAKNNGVFLMIAHVIRFWPEYVYLKKIYDEKPYGELLQVNFSRLGTFPDWSFENWMLDFNESGGAQLDLHIHDADFIYYMLGKPKAVSSISREEAGIISYISTQYIYDNHTVVTADCGWFKTTYPFVMSFSAVFENATLIYNGGKLTLIEDKLEGKVIDLNPDKENVQTQINISDIAGYFNEIDYFIDCIRTKTPPLKALPELSVESLEMVLAEIESGKAGKIIAL